MAQRTLADYITEKQDKRLMETIRTTLLKAPSDPGGPQRVVENEAMIRQMIEMFMWSLAEPYFKLIGSEIAVITDYTEHLSDKPNSRMPLPTHEGRINRRLQLFDESDHCPSDKVLVRVLRKAGFEMADAWDLRAFVRLKPEVEHGPTGTWVHAQGTAVEVGNDEDWHLRYASAQHVHTGFDEKGGSLGTRWSLTLNRTLHGPSLLRRIE